MLDFARYQIYTLVLFNFGLQNWDRGAKLFYFRPERQAFALPGKVDQSIINTNTSDFGLRLYCIVLREDLVLLLNGDIKTKLNPNDCPLVGAHFKKAIDLARVPDKASNEGFIRFTTTGIEIDEDFQIEI